MKALSCAPLAGRAAAAALKAARALMTLSAAPVSALLKDWTNKL